MEAERRGVADAPEDALARLRHDVRTPLAIVAGFAELLAADRPVSEEERRDFAARIVKAAGDMREMVDRARV
jgi:signal transduction histidine kinase